jgi:hypothetical protein
LMAGGVLAIPAGVALAGPADAARAWCRTDPDLSREGTCVRV